MGSLLAPVIAVYQVILYPLAKPTAFVLDRWLVEEGIMYFKESDMRTVIRKHIEAKESDIDRLEGIGVLNFLALDDIEVSQQGKIVDPRSVVQLPTEHGMPVFPAFAGESNDPFLQQIEQAEKKWVILVDEAHHPLLVLNANSFLRHALFSDEPVDPLFHCHRPIVVTDTTMLLGKILSQFVMRPSPIPDDVIDNDLILVWSNKEKRVITGADILGRLLRGIAIRDISKLAS